MRLISIDTSLARKCMNPRCSGRERELNRHHKGCDSLVGRYNIGIGRQYDKFLDCVDLCIECHAIIHFIYKPYEEKWLNRTPRGAAHFRKVLIQVCDDWLSGKLKTPRVPKKHIRKFIEGYREWQKSQEKSATG